MTDDEAILALVVAGAENAGVGQGRQGQVPDRNEQALPQSLGAQKENDHFPTIGEMVKWSFAC